MWNQNELQVHKGAYQLRLRWHNYIYTAKMLCYSITHIADILINPSKRIPFKNIVVN